MTRLIVTTDSSTAGAIQQAGLADLVIAIERRLVWGPLPSDVESDAFFGPRTTQPHGLHWLDDTPPWRLEESGAKDLGLIELFAKYDSVEFWRFRAQLRVLEARKRGSSGSSREAACSLSMSFRAIRRATSCTYADIGKLEPCSMGLRGARGQRSLDWMKAHFPWTCTMIQPASIDTSSRNCR